VKLIEIAVADRGTRDNSAYLQSNKRQKLDEDAEDEAHGALDAIEDLIINSLSEEFTCWCGEAFSGRKNVLCKTPSANFCSYCLFFDHWRQVLLKMEPIEGA
jgi:hypothetical protein